ncbi:hypothetical protein ARMGADRAFT_1049148 [Armillaria gallica]|uniref:Uncharacterized protein n=1 Tax=Armillaria gallica TaxID=47427 RepID=A0A2H3CC11_ARMGA|nr:hypothetical protein ARMGADRAFT_1049148 [Armillaria gallica]
MPTARPSAQDDDPILYQPQSSAELAALRLLSSFLPPELRRSYQWTTPPPSPSDDSTTVPALPPQFDWNDLELMGDVEFEDSPEKRGLALLAQGLLDFLAQDPDDIQSDDELEERSEMGDNEDVSEPEAAHTDQEEGDVADAWGRKRARMTPATDATSREWHPWPDRMACTLDILMHLPRSVFSHEQLDLYLWLLEANKVDDVPSVKSMQALNERLQKMCGIDTMRKKGALGHLYYLNSLSQIIAQEMANPQVRPHLHFYPEDSGKRLAEVRQGSRWLHELPDELLTPMLRINNIDYYIHETAMLRDRSLCVPFRWFMRGGKHYGRCWKLQAMSREGSVVWRVIKTDGVDVSEDEFLKNAPELRQDAVSLYNFPSDPTLIHDVFDETQSPSLVVPWRLTNPIKGNTWRERSKGARVMAFPILLYCDDTSGNMSKKWNKHNSFLFVLAGLPRVEAQREYNIHYLCTSNLALPLEMLDGIVEELEKGQSEGIWAWDCVNQEAVLLIPSIMAMLGDNPMQSEFACHIGLRGKFFCRVCWVKGKDALDENPCSAEVSRESGSYENAGQGLCKGKFLLSSGFMNICLMLLQPGIPRNKSESIQKLKSQFVQAKELYGSTKVKTLRTQSGLKDTYQGYFIDRLVGSYKSKTGTQGKQMVLDAEIHNLPDETMSPVWQIEGLDPHRDTPVEILHVILLGFLKYMWRDVINHQLHNNTDKKNELEIKLASVNIDGLGIDPVAAHTLVTYSGSLTGRDFRVLAQIAPFVLKGLVSEDCFETWVALSKLVPLIWQPEIEDIDEYLTLVQKEIDYFLLCVTRWTVQWFNKPKFHILVHLPEHIRRLGPAMLFATEGFESFNAVIRGKSIHSNRHAPSRDIGLAFAQGNRVRHLLSGGMFLLQKNLPSDDLSSQSQPTAELTEAYKPRPWSHLRQDWTSIGRGPASLMATNNTASRYLGICISDKKPAQSFANTLTGAQFPQLSVFTPSERDTGIFATAKEMYLHNGDRCLLGGYVVVRNPGGGSNVVAKIVEILQRKFSVAAMSQSPDCVLIAGALLSETSVHGMPRIAASGHYGVVALSQLLCTVNVQHDCSRNDCTPDASVPIFQERQQTDKVHRRIRHRNPADIVLNTAQMRDAVHVQPFRRPSPALNADEIIHRSVQKEVDISTTAKHATTDFSSSAVPFLTIRTPSVAMSQTTPAFPILRRDSSQPVHPSPLGPNSFIYDSYNQQS